MRRICVGYRADAVLIPEPEDEALVRANTGVVWFTVEVRGKPVHVRRWGREQTPSTRSGVSSGRSARSRRALERRAHPPPPFRNRGAPDQPQYRADQRRRLGASCPPGRGSSAAFALYPGTRAADAAAEIERAVADFAAGDPIPGAEPARRDLNGFMAEGYVLAEGSEAEAVLGRAHERATRRALTSFMSPSYLDTRVHALYEGIPALCYGPRAENIHGFDERVSLASVQRSTVAMALFVAEWCGVRARSALRDEPVGAEALEQGEERVVRGLVGGKAEAAAAAHIRHHLDRPSQDRHPCARARRACSGPLREPMPCGDLGQRGPSPAMRGSRGRWAPSKGAASTPNQSAMRPHIQLQRKTSPFTHVECEVLRALFGAGPEQLPREKGGIGHVGETVPLHGRAGKHEGLALFPAERRVAGQRGANVHGIAHRLAMMVCGRWTLHEKPSRSAAPNRASS